MLRLTVLFALASVCRAGHIPFSYQSVSLHPTHHPIKVLKADAWKVKEWKTPKVEEWKVAEWTTPAPATVEVWKSVEWKVPEEWNTPVNKIEPPVEEWIGKEWKEPINVAEWKVSEDAEWKVPENEEWKVPETVEWTTPKSEVSEWTTPKPEKIIEWAPVHVEWKKPETPATYDFKYEVHDDHTGDIKRQSETAVHGAVKGQYSLIDSDGYKRIVDYTADDHNGFQATVKREPTEIKIPIPTKKSTETW